MRQIRVISRLDVKGQNVINTIHLEGLRVVGDPNSLALKYYEDGADEILIIDQVASLYNRGHLSELTRIFAENIFIPVTAGGGISSVKQARQLLRSGADKIAVNTEAIKNPKFITDLANRFGTQCVVVSIQAKKIGLNKWEALRDGGRERTGFDVLEWARKAVELGAGEILITSVDFDGTRKGFDLSLLSAVSDCVEVPVIASGGLGNPDDAVKVLTASNCEAIAVADYLHMNRGTINDLKSNLNSAGFSIRL